MTPVVTATIDEISADVQEPTILSAADIDDALSIFLPEASKKRDESVGGEMLRNEATEHREPPAEVTTPDATAANDRTSELINHLKRALGAYDVARDLAKTVDVRYAGLKRLDQDVRGYGSRLETLKREILDGTAQADDIVRLIKSFELRLAELREQEQRLQTVESTVAAFECRAQTVRTDLESQVGACEARQELVVKAIEQLGRDATETIVALENRVGGCEVRAHTAGETIAHLHEVSTRTLPELQERLREADKKNQSVDQRITEAVRIATSLTALTERLPEVDRCDQQLGRIEIAMPQAEQRLVDLNASIEKQIRRLAINEQLVQHTLEEAQKTDAVVSALEQRIVDLSRSQPQLDHLEQQVGQFEARAATAASEFTQATRAKNDLEHGVAALQNDLQRVTQAADDETKKLVEFTEQAERCRDEQTQKAAAVVSGLEARLADIRGSNEQLCRVEEQLGQLEQRAASAANGIQQATDVRNHLEQEVVGLQNQLQQLTKTGDDETKKLVELTQQAQRCQQEQALKASAVLSGLETRMTEIHNGLHLVDRVEQQLGRLEARATAAAAEVKQATDARNDLEQEVAALRNQLSEMTAAADDEAKRLVDLKRQAERYQLEETQNVSAVLSGLESRIADLGKSHQQLHAVDKQVRQFEQRAAAASADVKQATWVRNTLEHEISEVHDQVRRLTKAAQDEAKKLAELRRQAKRHRRYLASQAYAHDRSTAEQLGRRRAGVSTPFSPDRLIAGAVTLALSVAVVALVGSVWQFNRAEDAKRATPPPPPLLVSRALTFTPMETAAPLTLAPITSAKEQPKDTRPAPVVPPVPVSQAVASEPVVETSVTEPAGAPPASSIGAGAPAAPIATAAKASQFVGTLMIESDPPGATVFVNQQSAGETPLSLQGLRAGSYVVRVESDGYQRWSTAVTVSAVREARVTATLQRSNSR